MSAQIIGFPDPNIPVEWRIEVNSREDNTVTCTYVPAQKSRKAHWSLWIHATMIDYVPGLIKVAERAYRFEKAAETAKTIPSLGGSPK